MSYDSISRTLMTIDRFVITIAFVAVGIVVVTDSY